MIEPFDRPEASALADSTAARAIDIPFDELEEHVHNSIETAIAMGAAQERGRLVYLWVFAFGVGVMVGCGIAAVIP